MDNKNNLEYKLTNPQESIWLINSFYENTNVSNICGTLLIHEKVDFDLLNKAVNRVVQENDAMRIHFKLRDGKPFQYVTEYVFQQFPIYSLNSKDELPQLEDKFAKITFDVIDSCLYDFKLLKFKNGHGGVNLTIHHLISDAWSFGLITNEIIGNYSKLLKSKNAESADMPSYFEFAQNEQKYLGSEKYENDRKFWEDVFATCPSCVSLSQKSFPSSSPVANRKSFSLGNSAKIVDFCKKNKISVFTFLLTIFSIYFHRISGSSDIVIGSPILNRNGIREKNTLGLFINTLPLKVEVDDDIDFIQLAQSVYKNQFSILRHHKYPYSKIVEFVRNKYHVNNSLYDTIISYQNARDNSNSSEIKYSTGWAFNGSTSNNLEVHIYDMDDTGILQIFYDYRVDLFTEEDIVDIHNRILHIINQIMANPGLPLKHLEIVTEKEKNDLLYTFNDTKFDYDESKTINQLFEEQCLCTPNKIAVAFGDSTLTYSELNKKANQLAYCLRNQFGIGEKKFVGILTKRSLEMAIGLLAILKAGATYVPIDPDYPQERIDYMLSDSAAELVLVDDKTQNLFKLKHSVNISLNKEIYSMYPDDNLKPVNNSSDLMYVIYTSGSTGKPKGVMLTHKNAHNYLCGLKNVIDFSESKVILSITTICFDIFVTEFWGGLLNGLTVVIANEQEQNIAQDLSKLCKKYNVNIIQTTPSRYSILLEEDASFLDTITDLLVGGEALPKSLLSQLQTFPGIKIFNMYGPTETTVWSTIKPSPNIEHITIGKPIANTKVYVLDDNCNLLPPNIHGNLYIGGDGVSMGYHNRPDLNKQVFIKSPFDDSILYNTKDLAYMQKDGEIVHLGRSDFQVKVHGFRVELGEIENAIMKFPGISGAVVLLQKDSLNAFVVSGEEVNKERLLDQLMKELPHYMIPKNIVQIDAIPLTPNGKVDRKNEIFTKISKEKSKKVAPRTENEKLLYDAIKKTLNINVGVTDNFFEYGIDSLMIIKLVSALYLYKINLSVQDFYDNPSIERLAKKLENKNVETTPKNVDHIKDIEKIRTKLSNYTFSAPKNVLLTGATGFLGIHVLDSLISNTDCNVYCLVRGKAGKDPKTRLINKLEYYFPDKYHDIIDNRVFVVESDLTLSLLGLPKKIYDDLGSKITCVIHCAANVKHYGDSKSSEKANIEATKNVIQFCLDFNAILNHISTLTVSGYGLVPVKYDGVFDEDKFYINQDYDDNIYVKTKFLAEEEIFDSLKDGLIANIYRVGNLTNRFSDCKFQSNFNENSFINKLKAIKALKILPESLKDYKLEITPVDLCAASIVKLAVYNNIHYNVNVYHLYDNNYVPMNSITNILNENNINVKYVPDQKFEEEVAVTSASADVLPGFVDQFGAQSASPAFSKVNFSNSSTNQLLSNLNFTWPSITDDYLNNIIRRI